MYAAASALPSAVLKAAPAVKGWINTVGFFAPSMRASWGGGGGGGGGSSAAAGAKKGKKVAAAPAAGKSSGDDDDVRGGKLQFENCPRRSCVPLHVLMCSCIHEFMHLELTPPFGTSHGAPHLLLWSGKNPSLEALWGRVCYVVV